MAVETYEGPQRGGWASTATSEAPEQSPARSIFARSVPPRQAAPPLQGRYDREAAAAAILTGTQDGDAARLIAMRMAREWAWERSAEAESRWQSTRPQAVPEWQQWPWQAVVWGVVVVAAIWLLVWVPQTAAVVVGR